MSINPLQTKGAEGLLYEAAPARPVEAGSKGSAFTELLGRLQGGSAKAPVDGERAAVELLQLELMQSSLSLGSDGEASGAAKHGDLLGGMLGSLSLPGVLPSPPYCGAAGQSAPNTGSAPPESAEVSGLEDTAARFLGTPYRFGGEGPSGIDCSSFVQQVFHEHQIELPRTAREQIRVGTEVPVSELQKGDLVFFRTYASYPSHVGIYLGDGKMIHASSGKGEVTVSDMNSEYYRTRYLGAKRVA